MELSRIHIKNFRSIKDETIYFDHNCLILLGKNEAGKSNVLKAIAAVFGQYKVSDKDKRKKIDNEKISEYEIRAVLKVSNDEINKVLDTYGEHSRYATNINKNERAIFFKYFKACFSEFEIQLTIGNSGKKNYTYNEQLGLSYEIDRLSVADENVGLVDFINTTREDINSTFFYFLSGYYDVKPYKCHYWKYQDSYLLPDRVNIDDFVSYPENVKGLENIFILSGRDQIKKEFLEAFEEDGDYANLFEQVSKFATITFKKIWPDFKDTSIQLIPDGEDVLVKVVNKTKYTFEDRSDGFKKFISILLMLSTQTRSNKIQDRDIVLIDEPDQSLYPTSAMYLKHELLEMSKMTKIVYSTHSQYMIDSDCLDRHLIVEKEADITTLRREDANAPFSTDELLKRAIGSSIFECLKPKNIIFEGYLDRQLFIKYCNSQKRDSDFKEYGTVYLGGISGAETLVQLLILANKKFIVVADSDETSRSKRIDFNKNYQEYKKNWLAYADVCDQVSTMEDFFDIDYVGKQIKKAGYNEFVYDKGKNVINNIDKAVNKDKDKKQEVKNQLMNSATKENIKVDYNLYLNKLKETLDTL